LISAGNTQENVQAKSSLYDSTLAKYEYSQPHYGMGVCLSLHTQFKLEIIDYLIIIIIVINSSSWQQ